MFGVFSYAAFLPGPTLAIQQLYWALQTIEHYEKESIPAIPTSPQFYNEDITIEQNSEKYVSALPGVLQDRLKKFCNTFRNSGSWLTHW